MLLWGGENEGKAVFDRTRGGIKQRQDLTCYIISCCVYGSIQVFPNFFFVVNYKIFLS